MNAKRVFIPIAFVTCASLGIVPSVYADVPSAQVTPLEEGVAVAGGVLGTDYTMDAATNTLTILSPTSLTVSGSGELRVVIDGSVSSAKLLLDGARLKPSGTKDVIAVADGQQLSLGLKSSSIEAAFATPIRVRSGGSLLLTVEGASAITGQYSGCLQVDHGGSLVIDGATDNDGENELTVTSKNNAAAIGEGGTKKGWGNITIKGATVRAIGSPAGGAGLGGAGGSRSSYEGGKSTPVGTIRIEGGIVHATGGPGGAGIGAGKNSVAAGKPIESNGYVTAGRIEILGGTVYAEGGSGAAAIGGGQNTDGGDISITGGVIEQAASVGKMGEGCSVDPSDGAKVNQVVVNGGVIKPTDGEGKNNFDPKEYLAEGSEYDPQTGEISRKVISVGDAYYKTLAEAIEAGSSKEAPIVLHDDIVIDKPIEVTESVFILGSDYCVSVKSDKGRLFNVRAEDATISIVGVKLSFYGESVPIETPSSALTSIEMQNCRIETGSNEGKIVNFAQGGPVRYEFINNTVNILSRGLLVNVYNGSCIVDNEIDLLSEHYSDAYRTGAISLTAVSGGDGVEIKGNTFKNANRVLGVDHATIEGSKTAFSKNKMVNCRFAFEFNPKDEGTENSDAGTYDIEYNYYSFDGKAMAPRVEDASSSGSHFDGSTEYAPTGASRVKNSVYYLRDTMRDQDLNIYVPPVTPPTPSDKTEVEQNQDGSTTTTVTKPDGSQTITHETATGTSSTVTKDEGGNVTSTEVSVSKSDAESGKVQLPIEKSEPAADAEKAPAVEVKVPSTVTADKPVQVTVPVAKEQGAEPNYGVVVLAVDEDGNETVLPKCAVDKDGNVVFGATGDVTIKVVDAAKDMPDVTDADWFAGDVVDFATARGIVNGVDAPSGKQFQGYGRTTRGMFVAMLHNLESNPEAASEGSLADVPSGAFYADAAAWALEEGILSGVDMPDGTKEFQGESAVTREPVAVFLMRYAEHLGMDVSKRAEIGFPDAGEVSGYAEDAMSWAVASGLFTGDDVTGELNPTDGAARAEVAAVLMRFINLMYA